MRIIYDIDAPAQVVCGSSHRTGLNEAKCLYVSVDTVVPGENRLFKRPWMTVSYSIEGPAEHVRKALADALQGVDALIELDKQDRKEGSFK